MSRRSALALGATLLVIVVGVATYLVLSERSSQRRLDAAAAGLDLAGDGAALAAELRATARQTPSAAAEARLRTVAERAAVLADRADRLPEALDQEVATKLGEATRGQLESARALEQALAPAGDATRTLERADGDSDSRRPLRRARRALAQVEVAIVPAGRRFDAALESLRGAFGGLKTQLEREGELEGPVEIQLAEAADALRQLEGDSSADFGETRTRVARLEDRTGEAIEAIDRKVAAERRAERREAREEKEAEDEAEESSRPLVDLPNGRRGYALPEEDRSLRCVGVEADTGECVGD